MSSYFQYLGAFLSRFFAHIGRFFITAFIAPWAEVDNNFGEYGEILGAYSNKFGFGGWLLFVVFAILFVGLVGAIGFGLYLLIRKYVKFAKTELDKDELRHQVERLNIELYNSVREKDKILGLQMKALGGKNLPTSVPGQNEEEVKTIEEVASRFPKLTHVDAEYYGKDSELPEVEGLTLEQLCTSFRNFAASQLGLYYKINVIRQLFSGIGASKLVILEGISGTGKTSLPYALGKFLGHDAEICSVQPNWKDRSELIGYYNEFTKKFNESEFLRALYTTVYRRDLNLIVLDEMNLARVEYYFAEFLSVLEMPNPNEWNVELIGSIDKHDPKLFKEGKLKVPQNVMFFGTANNDDSTFTISDKVYDRAISLFFDDKGIAFDAEYQNSMVIPYSQIARLYDEAMAKHPVNIETLHKFEELDNFVIKKFRLAFGNRILKQLKKFIPIYVACGGTELDGFDFIFTNKILKKFESLNIAFLKNELKELNSMLDKLFGKETFPMAHNYIEGLIRMNS
ncbi:MAG TPA: AAA family ATPase [Bacilli bacterium]|nr:AAA family ATPase [Bacilli bacterium]HPS18661.1 AAA family ATPase [Bacilli bacterium]